MDYFKLQNVHPSEQFIVVCSWRFPLYRPSDTKSYKNVITICYSILALWCTEYKSLQIAIWLHKVHWCITRNNFPCVGTQNATQNVFSYYSNIMICNSILEFSVHKTHHSENFGCRKSHGCTQLTDFHCRAVQNATQNCTQLLHLLKYHDLQTTKHNILLSRIPRRNLPRVWTRQVQSSTIFTTFVDKTRCWQIPLKSPIPTVFVTLHCFEFYSFSIVVMLMSCTD